MSNLSDGPDALDQLDAWVRRLGATLTERGWDAALHQLADELPDARERLAHVGRMTEAAANKVLNTVGATRPVCRAAAVESLALAERLDDASGHPELGVGEARAALAEAAAALRHQAGLQKTHHMLLADILRARDVQALSGQVIVKLVRIIDHAEQQLQQVLARGGDRPGAAAPAGPQLPDQAVGQEGLDNRLASLGR